MGLVGWLKRGRLRCCTACWHAPDAKEQINAPDESNIIPGVTSMLVLLNSYRLAAAALAIIIIKLPN
jgi:hypothetical protein